MQVWNVLHAARWKYRTQKWCKKSPSGHHRTTLSGYIFATKARIDNRKKNLLSSNISPTCPYNMVNFIPLAAEIVSLVWGTPANFNGFRILAALLHSTAALNRGRHLYSAGRPSRWALAHISSLRFSFSIPSQEIGLGNVSKMTILCRADVNHNSFSRVVIEPHHLAGALCFTHGILFHI